MAEYSIQKTCSIKLHKNEEKAYLSTLVPLGLYNMRDKQNFKLWLHLCQKNVRLLLETDVLGTAGVQEYMLYTKIGHLGILSILS